MHVHEMHTDSPADPDSFDHALLCCGSCDHLELCKYVGATCEGLDPVIDYIKECL